MFNLFAKRYSNREKVLFRFLRKSNLFDKLDDDEIAEFLPFLHLRTYRYNEVIFFRNDPSQAVYVIKQGSVRISLDVEAHFEDLLVLSAGESFGDNAVLEHTIRSYNAICNSEICEVYAIPQFNIFDIFSHHVGIKAKVLHGLARYYDRYMINLAKSYRNTFGLFDLANVYALTQRDVLKEK